MSTAGREDKPLAWLADEIKTPPLSREGRKRAGRLLRIVQGGETPAFPSDRPMPTIGPGVRELRFDDHPRSWRIVYRADADVVLVVAVFEKRDQKTPKRVIDECKRRLKRYDAP